MASFKEIRRYNFIAGTSVVSSGLFEKVGFFGGVKLGGVKLQKALLDKRIAICVKYKILMKYLTVSNTIKDRK